MKESLNTHLFGILVLYSKIYCDTYRNHTRVAELSTTWHNNLPVTPLQWQCTVFISRGECEQLLQSASFFQRTFISRSECEQLLQSASFFQRTFISRGECEHLLQSASFFQRTFANITRYAYIIKRWVGCS